MSTKMVGKGVAKSHSTLIHIQKITRANYGTFFMNKCFEIQNQNDLIFRDPITIVIVAIVSVATRRQRHVRTWTAERLILRALRNGAAIAPILSDIL